MYGDPAESVAKGATIEAEKRLHNRDNTISNIHIYDIIPLSLGIEILNNSSDPDLMKEGLEMSVILKRGTPIPTEKTQKYYTVSDNQTIVFKLFFVVTLINENIIIITNILSIEYINKQFKDYNYIIP